MSARYEITCDDDVATVTAPGGVTDSFSRHGTSTDRFGYGAIRQQARDIAELRTENAAILAANRDMQMHFDAMQDDLAAAVAERDDYRDEFSGLCHTLSVGSEGRPEMTAADWRKRVDQGIEFLIRPLQERAERAEAELALAREHIARSDEHHQAAAIAMTENLRAEVIRLASKIVQLQKESK